jgi:hypothetical protein
MTVVRAILLALALWVVPTAVLSQGATGDPMRPSYVRPAPRLATARRLGYSLQAVFGNEQYRVAIVNGQIVTLGDRIGGARIVRIGPHQVDMQANRRFWTLRLPVAAGS